VRFRGIPTDEDEYVVNPEGRDSVVPGKEEQRLLDAYRRYVAAYRITKPGTRAAVELARARLDLTLMLEAAGEPLAAELLAQLQRDADSVLRATPPLAEEE
jgi:hypothetical protein